MSIFGSTRNNFSPQRPLSIEGPEYDDNEEEFGKALSIHSLEKRRIPKQKKDDDSSSNDSVMIDNTLSPSPPKRKLGQEGPGQAFLKRMGSTNIDSGEKPSSNSGSPGKGQSKLNRMDSYEVSKGLKNQAAKNLSPDIIRPEKIIGYDAEPSKIRTSGKAPVKPQLKNMPK